MCTSSMYEQSLAKLEYKGMKTLQITQTRHPKSVVDRHTDGSSGPTTLPAFAKATQVKRIGLTRFRLDHSRFTYSWGRNRV